MYKSLKDVPYLKNNEIENKSNQIINEYFKSINKKIEMPIPVFDIVEYLGYDLDFRCDGIYSDTNILGGLIIDDKRIELNEILTKQEGRMNFTVAHEIGHIILHLPLFLNEKNKIFQRKNILCRKDQGIYGNNKKLIEIHADKFASYLIMPSDKVLNTFNRLYKKPIHIEKEKRSFIDILFKRKKDNNIYTIARKMIESGNFLNVSKLAMINRLIGLKMIRGLAFQKNKTKNK